MNNINYKILAIIFLAIIFICFGLFIITEKNEKNLIENRQLEKMPEFKIAKLDPFPNKFEAYFNDHFPFRSQIIKLFSKFTIKLLKKSPLENKVIIGNDNWLYMAGNYLDGYQGKSNFTKPELNSILKELEYRKSYCEERNIKFYFVIIPQKSTIYPEFIQKRYKCNNE